MTRAGTIAIFLLKLIWILIYCVVGAMQEFFISVIDDTKYEWKKLNFKRHRNHYE